MPAKSQQQQKFMGLVHAYKKGEVPASKVSKSVKDAAKSMSNKSVKKYAKTKHDELPKKVTENAGKDFPWANEKELKLISKFIFLSPQGIDGVIKMMKKDPSGFKKMIKKGAKAGLHEKRDYKAEYKKFQSSTKAKKYRAELNKYNRQKGTYGNGDGKDASHKGGKIVGFEAQSKNRGRREKSRLKKESIVSEGKLETLALNLLRNINKEIGISKYDHTKTAHFNKVMKFLRSKMPKAPDRKLGDIAMSYHDYRKKQPKATIPDIDSVKDMEKTLKKLGMKESVNEQQYFDPKGKLKKYMDKVLKQAGIRVIKYDPMKQSFYNGVWGGFYTVASSNKVDMPGQGKVKRSSAVLPVYIDKKGEVELGVSGDGFKLGKVGSSQVLKNLKDFKKSDLEESINERAWTPAQEKAVKELDKKFYKLIGKKGIEPYTYEASQMWTSGGFRKEMRKIFGKDVKESVNEISIGDRMANRRIQQIRKYFDQQYKTIKNAVERDARTGSKEFRNTDNRGEKYKLTVVINRLKELRNKLSRKDRGLADMFTKNIAPIEKVKDKMKEGTCGYGLDGNLGEEPAGPHLIKKKKKKVKENKQEKLQIAKTILSQLGGNRFVAMTGAKSFGYDSKGSVVSLQFKIGRNAKQVNIVRINYIRGKDLYEMNFYKGTKLLKKVSNVYADQLRKIFTKHTGMYTSL